MKHSDFGYLLTAAMVLLVQGTAQVACAQAVAAADSNQTICSASDSACTEQGAAIPPRQAETPKAGTVSAPALAAEPRRLFLHPEQYGISFHGALIHDWSKDLNDSVGTGAGFGRLSFDLSATINGKRAFNLGGNTIFVRLKQHVEEFGATGDGAAQLYSNIDGPSRTSLFEVWAEQKVFGDKLRFKAGKIDANTEFATVQGAGDFLNSSMGYSPTILAFPTYPEPQPGVNAFVRPGKNYSLAAGIFRAAGGGALSVVEPGATWTAGQTDLAGRAAFGYWRLGKTINCFDGNTATSSQGFYTVLEQALWRSSSSGSTRSVSSFFQFGRANGNVSPFTQHFGGGIVLQALLNRRADDSLGLGITRVGFSSQPGAHFDRNAETILESYYKVAITRHLSLVQDFQFLHHPGGLRSLQDCLVVTPRLVASF